MPKINITNRTEFNKISQYLKIKIPNIAFDFEFFNAVKDNIDIPVGAIAIWQSENDYFCIKAYSGDKWITLIHTFTHGKPDYVGMESKIKEYFKC